MNKKCITTVFTFLFFYVTVALVYAKSGHMYHKNLITFSSYMASFFSGDFYFLHAYDFLAVCPEENKLHAHEDTSVKHPFLSQNKCHDRNNQIAGVGVIDRSCFHFI